MLGFRRDKRMKYRDYCLTQRKVFQQNWGGCSSNFSQYLHLTESTEALSFGIVFVCILDLRDVLDLFDLFQKKHLD